MTLRQAAHKLVSELEAIGDQTGWADGDDTDMVISWRDLKPLKEALKADQHTVADWPLRVPIPPPQEGQHDG